MSAHKKFEELENSVGLIPDYYMSNGLPVRAVLPNSDASTSGRMAWQCSNDTAQQEFGEGQQLLQENVFAPVQVSNNDAGPSKQETLPLPQNTYEQTMHQELCQQDPSVPRNDIPYYLTHGNIFDSRASFSAHSTIPSHSFAPAQDDSSISGSSLTTQYNGYLSSSTTDAPCTSYHVTGAENVVLGTSSDGVGVRICSLNHVQTDTFSGLPSLEEWLEQAHAADQGFAPASDEPMNSYSQFDTYEH